MKRVRWISASLAAFALTATACSDSGPKALSEDDFVSELESICRSAQNDIEDLDVQDAGFFDDGLDIVDETIDAMQALRPPNSLKGDFEDFLDNLDDQRKELTDLSEAVADEDEDAAVEASGNLEELSADADSIAEDLGADRCVGLGNTETADTTPETVPADTTPITTPETTPVETTPITEPPATEPPVTEPPATEATTAETVPVMTEPPFDPNATGEALDASEVWSAPAGFEWGVLDSLAGIVTPSVNPTIAPILIDYSAGIVHSTTGGPSAIIYITEVSTSPWTQEEIDAHFLFTIGEGGTDTQTPGGLQARIKLDAADGLDGAVAWIDGAAIAVVAPSGADVLGIIDEFYTANVAEG